MDELLAVALSLNPDIILISESWTHTGISKAFLSIDGYELSCRADRTGTTDGRRGGLLIYSKLGFVVTEVVHKTDFNQILALSIAQSKQLTVNLVYCSPNSSTCFFYKHNVYKPTEAQFCKKLSIF